MFCITILNKLVHSTLLNLPGKVRVKSNRYCKKTASVPFFSFSYFVAVDMGAVVRFRNRGIMLSIISGGTFFCHIYSTVIASVISTSPVFNLAYCFRNFCNFPFSVFTRHVYCSYFRTTILHSFCIFKCYHSDFFSAPLSLPFFLGSLFA